MHRIFDRRRKHVYITGILTGPLGTATANLAVDTGAVKTVVRPAILRYIGCDPARSTERANLVSATGNERISFVQIDRFECLGEARVAFSVAAHELPQQFFGDGLLGLDFLRDYVLTIDFVQGTIAIEKSRPPRSRWWPFAR